MKTVRPFRRVFVIITVAVFAALFVPTASAQKFHDTWFKLKLAAKGHTFDTNSGSIAKLNFSQPVYMHFLTNINPGQYTIRVWTLRDGVWTNATTATETVIGPNESFMSDLGIRFFGSSSNSFHIYHTVFLSSKTNSTGGVQSAVYDGGGEIDEGTIFGNDYYGSCTVKGTRVDPSKLPFSPLD